MAAAIAGVLIPAMPVPFKFNIGYPATDPPSTVGELARPQRELRSIPCKPDMLAGLTAAAAPVFGKLATPVAAGCDWGGSETWEPRLTRPGIEVLGGALPDAARALGASISEGLVSMATFEEVASPSSPGGLFTTGMDWSLIFRPFLGICH